MHVYVLDHIVSHYYRTARWMFTKLDRDELLMVPHLCLGFSANSAQGGSRAGQNMSMRVPFSKGLLLQIGRLQQQNQCISVI